MSDFNNPDFLKRSYGALVRASGEVFDSIPEHKQRKILELVAGGMSLKGVCNMGGMPNWIEVQSLIQRNSIFRRQVRRARDLRSEGIAEERVDALSGLKRVLVEESKRGNFNVQAFREYRNFAKELSKTHEQEVAIEMRGVESGGSGDGSGSFNVGGGKDDIPYVDFKNPYKDQPIVNMEELDVRNNPEAEE